ncbi:hypothetical protein K474DRAFT_98140 [Panus rudis PR-1116 ss-1]|nr:hypothetical protein K474DRAFT_98140 [Panus rudis PR-1116 ss-1]
MGRWTLDHYDEVLRNKMKSLVNGACKRIQLEEGEPSISYEAFVENLDEGDSFTTSLIDILVREMAERRTRPEESDRRLISERTAKALRLQSTPLQVYRSRPYRTLNRRYNPSFNPSDYLTAPPDVMELSDTEDDFGATTGANAVEGARLPTELFDAYSTFHTLDGALSHSGEPAVIPTAGRPLTPIEPETVTSPRPYSPPIIPPSFRSRLYSNPESSTAANSQASTSDSGADGSRNALERRPIVAPRLRRGGVRAPESLLSRRSSSSSAQETEEQQSQAQHVHDHEHDENHHDVADQNVPILQVPANREHDHNHLQHPQESQRSDSRGLQRALADMLADVGESSARNTEDERRTQLPTPRSISPNDHDEHA